MRTEDAPDSARRAVAERLAILSLSDKRSSSPVYDRLVVLAHPVPAQSGDNLVLSDYSESFVWGQPIMGLDKIDLNYRIADRSRLRFARTEQRRDHHDEMDEILVGERHSVWPLLAQIVNLS